MNGTAPPEASGPRRSARRALPSGLVRLNYLIPDDLHREAKAVAALRGMTLRDFVIDALTNAVSQPRQSEPHSGR